MKLIKDHILGVILGLAPIIIIAVVFRDNDIMAERYIKKYMLIMAHLLLFLKSNNIKF